MVWDAPEVAFVMTALALLVLLLVVMRRM